MVRISVGLSLTLEAPVYTVPTLIALVWWLVK